jgi:hypothetical protein
MENDSIRRHSQTAQVAYHDLVSLLLDEAASDIVGTPTLREVNGKGYWYDRYRIGSEIKERYLGEANPQLQHRIERHESLRARQKERRKERARLVRLLRSERLLGLDATPGSLVAAMAKAGVFRLGGTLIGTTAFRLYEGELGLRLSLDETAMTQDIDIASFQKLSLALQDSVEPGLTKVFDQLRFAPVPSMGSQKVWRWRQSPSQALVEFLTPSFNEEEGLRDLAALGVSARALHHLNYLIAEPINAAVVYREGVLVRIPRPERFAIHKLIVANRRLDGPDSLKARKDLMQSKILIDILSEDRPADLADAYDDAMSRGPKWKTRIEQSLARSPRIAEAIKAARQHR